MNEQQSHKVMERWLRRSQEQQKTFMNHIAERLGRPMVTMAPERTYKGAPEYWNSYTLTEEERVELFQTNWEQAGGHTVRIANLEEAKKVILDFCNETGAKNMVMQDQDELDALHLSEELSATCTVHKPSEVEACDAWKQLAASADIGLAVVDFAVAYTGSIVVRSDHRKPRATSLLPKVFIAIVPKSCIKTKLGEVMEELDQHTAGKDIPAGIHFISGPSRSADIENDLTIGVHGPGIVHAFIVDEVN